jgi:hypothetical protein
MANSAFTPPTASVTPTNVVSLENKEVVKRVTSEVSSATPSTNVDNADIHRVTALAVNITSMTANLTGTPYNKQMVMWEIVGTATRTIVWGASFVNTTNYTWPTTTVGTTPIKALGMWNGSAFECIGVA